MQLKHTALSVRSDFSIGESSLQIPKLVDRAVELGYEALAITDTMTLAGMPTFFEKANKAKIKPMIGVVLRIVDDPAERVKDREQGGYRIKAYAQTPAGVQSLFKLLSLGMQSDHFYYHSRVSLTEVMDTLVDCTVTSGDLHSIWHREDCVSISAQLSAAFGGNYFIELVALDTPLFERLNATAAKTAGAYLQKMIMTRPVFYLTPEDADATDVLRAVSSNTDVSSIFLARPYVRDMALLPCDEYLKRADSTWATYMADPSTVMPIRFDDWSKDFVEGCTYKYEKLPPSLPKMDDNEFVLLTQHVGVGWANRFMRPVWGHKPTPEELPAYKARLAYELGVLKKLNFAGYFLLVRDIVAWSKEQGIMVGPGRGSVGGSLVAYLIGITDIDPIRFDLLFERFINPDRIDLPDADLDFMSSRRHEIVDMLIAKYGTDHVCGIVNFNTLGPASAIRDVARLHGLQPWEYACSKQVEKEHGVNIPLADSAKVVPEIEKFSLAHPIIWDHALRLEGANRALGKHAAGVVICAEPVINRGVVSTQSGMSIVQWDKSRVEDFGLIKIDVLGLNTLDVIGAVLKYVKARHFKTIDVLSLPLDDERVLEAFGRGDTTGVFQFEGGGMKKLLRDLRIGGPLTFDDICAATALFRPGPLDAGLCDRYIQVKQGVTTPLYEHPALEECLSDTFGVIVYQEQVMKICRVLSGFTGGEADGVRKAIGKKDMAKMKTYAEQFVAGAMLGQAEVELENGTKIKVHRARKFPCADGMLRTVDQALADDVDIVSFA